MKIKDKFINDIKSGKIKINMNGHHGFPLGNIVINDIDNKWERNSIIEKISGYMCIVNWIDIEYNDVPFNPSSNSPVILYIRDVCGECGKEVIWEFDGTVINVVNKDRSDNFVCPETGGVKPWKININCPSGRIVFANDLCSLVPECDKDRYVNYKSEIKKTTFDYAEKNMLHHFVGNTCPSVYVDKEVITIGNENNGNIAGVEIGSICTDLWWFSAIDEDMFYELATIYGWTKTYIDSIIECVADVNAGKYEVTCSPRSADEFKKPEIYAVMKRIY